MVPGFVYILTNKNHTTLYVGMTIELATRTKKHREKFYPKSFSAKYNVNKLVYYEICESAAAARAREKQLKAGSRRKKIALIERYNREWKDLFDIICNESWNGSPLVDHTMATEGSARAPIRESKTLLHKKQ